MVGADGTVLESHYGSINVDFFIILMLELESFTVCTITVTMHRQGNTLFS